LEFTNKRRGASHWDDLEIIAFREKGAVGRTGQVHAASRRAR